MSRLQVDDSGKWNTLCKNYVSEVSVVRNNDSIKLLSMLNNDFVVSCLQLLLKDISEIVSVFNKEINYIRVNVLIRKVFIGLLSASTSFMYNYKSVSNMQILGRECELMIT